jgi:hypothetical protein
MKKLIIVFLFSFAFLLKAQSNYKWTVVSKMPYPVRGGQLAYDINTQGTKIYVLGGFSDSLQKPVDWIQEYDVNNTDKAHAWKIVGHMKRPRSQFVADIWNDKITYFGDSLNPNRNLEAWSLKSVDTSAALLDTNTNFERSFSTGHVVGNTFYIIGGTPPPKTAPPYIVGYDLNTKQINLSSTEADSEDKPKKHMSFVYNDNIYIFGGATIGIDRTISKFNIPAKSLSILSTRLIENRAGGAAVYNPTIHKGFIIGGYKEPDSVLASVEQIDILGDSTIQISQGPSLNYARRNLMVVNYKGKIAVFGGQDKEGKVVPWVEILDTLVTEVKKQKEIPTTFELYPNFPNPFNPSTKITYNIAKRTGISLDVFSILGQHIVSLVKGDYEAGKYTTEWNGVDKFNRSVPSGVYFLRLSAGDFIKTQKMVLLK